MGPRSTGAFAVVVFSLLVLGLLVLWRRGSRARAELESALLNERERARSAREQAWQNAFLGQVAEELRSFQSEDDLWSAATTALGRALEASRVVAYEKDPRGVYRLRAQFASDGVAGLDEGSSLPASVVHDRELQARIARSDLAVEEDPELRALAAGMRLRSLVVVPVEREGRERAAIAIHFCDGPPKWTETDRRFLQKTRRARGGSARPGPARPAAFLRGRCPSRTSSARASSGCPERVRHGGRGDGVGRGSSRPRDGRSSPGRGRARRVPRRGELGYHGAFGNGGNGRNAGQTRKSGVVLPVGAPPAPRRMRSQEVENQRRSRRNPGTRADPLSDVSRARPHGCVAPRLRFVFLRRTRSGVGPIGRRACRRGDRERAFVRVDLRIRLGAPGALGRRVRSGAGGRPLGRDPGSECRGHPGSGLYGGRARGSEARLPVRVGFRRRVAQARAHPLPRSQAPRPAAPASREGRKLSRGQRERIGGVRRAAPPAFPARHERGAKARAPTAPEPEARGPGRPRGRNRARLQ